MKNFLTITLILVIVAGAIYAFRGTEPQRTPTSPKLQIAASFYPLAYFAERIGGVRVVVTTITPAGVEPHEYELTPKDVATVEGSRLLLLNGTGFETWEDKVPRGSGTHRTEIVKVSDGLTEKSDPHIWLSPPLADRMVDNIEAGIKKLDPENADFYAQNAALLKADLVELDLDYRSGLSHCRLNTIVTSHSAFGYLSEAYGLVQIPIVGISPEAEPSAKELAAVATIARTKHIKYIFFETLVSPKLAETVAREIGAQTLVLSPIEGLTTEEIQTGKDYFTEMRSNLSHLQTALECKK